MGKIGKKNVYFLFKTYWYTFYGGLLVWISSPIANPPGNSGFSSCFPLKISLLRPPLFLFEFPKTLFGVGMDIFLNYTMCVHWVVALPSFSLLIRQTMGKGWLLVVHNSVFKYFKTSNSPKKICQKPETRLWAIIAQSLVSIKQLLDYELEISVMWWLTRAHCHP